MSATSTADRLIPLALTLQEITVGPLSAIEAKRLREEGGIAFRTILRFDATGVFDAVFFQSRRNKPKKSPFPFMSSGCEN